MPVSVNMTSGLLTSPESTERVADVLQATRSPLTSCCSLTETTIAEQKDSSAAALARISETGVRLTLDSFGIEASTLAQVMRLPVSSKMTNRSAVTEL